MLTLPVRLHIMYYYIVYGLSAFVTGELQKLRLFPHHSQFIRYRRGTKLTQQTLFSVDFTTQTQTPSTIELFNKKYSFTVAKQNVHSFHVCKTLLLMGMYI